MVRRLSRVLMVLLLVAVVPFAVHFVHAAERVSSSHPSVTIYVNEGCGGCTLYAAELSSSLKEIGIENITWKWLLSDLDSRFEVDQLHRKYGVPITMRGSLVVSVDDRFLFEGHVPINLIIDFLLNDADRYEFIVVLQDQMHNIEKVSTYKVMVEKGKVIECPIQDSISDCIESSPMKPIKEYPLLVLIAISGFVDGINPCAFGILLLFISFLFTLAMRRSSDRSISRKEGREETRYVLGVRRTILKIGFTFILAIFIAYLSIGVAIFRVFQLSSTPHIISKLASIVLIILGIINIRNHFFGGSWLNFKIPLRVETIKSWASKASVPLTFVIGLLVGICTLPCSGGIYIAILGMLTAATTFATGLGYIIFYNLMYISPLIFILIAATDKAVVLRMMDWSRGKRAKLWIGLSMIILGLAILYFY